MPYETLSVNLARTYDGLEDWQHPVFERFSKGAFTESIAVINSGLRSIEANIEHKQNDANARIAISSSNLKFYEDDKGLWADITNAETVSDELWNKIKNRIVCQASVEFAKNGKSETQRYGNMTIITRSKATLNGFAIVADGVYPATNVIPIEGEPTFIRSYDDKTIEEIKKEVEIENRIQIHEYYAATL
jgi:HK97 family phage prohead protease